MSGKCRGTVASTGVVVLVLLACKQGDAGGAGSKRKSDADCRNGFLCESDICLEAAKVGAIRQATNGPATPPPVPLSAAAPVATSPAAESGVAPTAAPGPEGLYVGIG
ncbi:MAG: hypothetical protein JW751_10840 [Polyangiaceae bacterium]|nr:hypothetical protein [Polyangiaceae bacterium]